MDLTTNNLNEPANLTTEPGQSAGSEAAGLVRAVIDDAAQVSEQAACASADGFEHKTETSQVTQGLGLNASDPKEQTHRTSQNLQAVRQASTILVRGAQEVSQEMFGLVQEQLTKRVEGLNRMASCRSVRALVAAQSELMRDNVQLMIDTNRRIAALSARIADEAAGALQPQGSANQTRHAA